MVPEQRVQGHSMLPFSNLWQGLIIDDFFVIGACGIAQRKEDTDVFKLLIEARDVYERHRLPGSVEKDVVAEEVFKAAS